MTFLQYKKLVLLVADSIIASKLLMKKNKARYKSLDTITRLINSVSFQGVTLLCGELSMDYNEDIQEFVRLREELPVLNEKKLSTKDRSLIRKINKERKNNIRETEELIKILYKKYMYDRSELLWSNEMELYRLTIENDGNVFINSKKEEE